LIPWIRLITHDTTVDGDVSDVHRCGDDHDDDRFYHDHDNDDDGDDN
jgi:hypothetical protein